MVRGAGLVSEAAEEEEAESEEADSESEEETKDSSEPEEEGRSAARKVTADILVATGGGGITSGAGCGLWTMGGWATGRMGVGQGVALKCG